MRQLHCFFVSMYLLLMIKYLFSHKIIEMGKHCFWALVVVIVMSGCSGNKIENVSIAGHIKGLGNDTIYVYGVDEFYNFVDTIYAKEDKFFYTIQADTAGKIILFFNETQAYPVFFNKKDKIIIEGDIEQLNMPTVKGNLANEKFGAFLRNVESIENLSKEVLEEKIDSFVHRNQSSPISVYLLDAYLIKEWQPNYKKIKQIIGTMTDKLQNDPSVERLKTYINLLEKTKKEEIIPSFSIPDINGEKISYATLNSKYIFIYFWASWDEESRLTHAKLRKINHTYAKYQKEKKKGEKKEFAIVGISLDVDKKNWKQAIKKDTLTWKQVCDLGGWNSNTAQQYAVEKLPATILVNSAGKVMERDIEWDSLSVRLSNLLKEK
ncbi:Thiol-disulfide oxidoreductase ResA [termite gut metagenome]|uniref:Thiol-disulfide oxidoreductase ResA n=1 Tax=termite gut metagenome TaxID=433724 RepID=A0A5J4RIY8_9ZZZZ